ncbi:MAG: hypothetical protein V3V00_06205 [Saprospiraceae bacterium]
MAKKKSKVKKSKSQKYITTKPSMFQWNEKWALALIFFVCAVLYIYIFDTKIDLNGDNTSYYLLAKALSQFQGYVYTFTDVPSPHSHFPPGYPLIMAPFMWISKSIVFMKIINGLLYGVAMWCVFKILQVLRKKTVVENTVITILIGFNYYVLKHSTIMMSEISLIATIGLALVLFLKMDKTKDHWKPNKKMIFLSALMALAFLIKTLAVPLVLGIVGHFIFKKLYKKAGITFLMFILFILPYQIRNKIHGLENSYLKQLMEVNPYRPEMGTLTFSTFIDRIVSNFDRYLSKEIPSGMFPIIEMGPSQVATGMHYILGIIAVTFMIIGMIRLKDYKAFIFLYIGASFAIFLMWPEAWFGVRFMLGVMPVMLILFYNGLLETTDFISKIISLKTNWIGYATLGVMMVLTLGIAHPSAQQANTITKLNSYSKQNYPLSFANYFDLAIWTKNSINSDEIILCRKPAMFALFSDGKTNNYPYTQDKIEFYNGIKNSNSKYIVLDQLGYSSTGRFVLPRVNAEPEKFEVIYQTKEPKTYLLKVKD